MAKAKRGAVRTRGARSKPLGGGRKRVLVVLFVPSVERDGKTSVDQFVLGRRSARNVRVFGGATAYPKAKGVWRDDDAGGSLVVDEPVVIHCYTTPAEISDVARLAEVGTFCRRMGREAHQGEIGLMIGDEYFAIRDYNEE